MKLFDKICLLMILTNVDSRLKEQHRPCFFNPLCTCSSSGPDLGSVCCHNVPFMTVPSHINNSAIYIMSLKDNKLRYLEDSSLNGTGLWKLQISNNLLTDLPPNSLAGLEKTLSILDLGSNNIIRIPKDAIQHLEKLNTLNLARNKISFINTEDFRNVGRSLKQLDVSNNALMHVQNDAFRNMVSLEFLNLAYNSLVTIDDITFQNGLNSLKQLILTGNQLQQIPLNALANLRSIRIVNMNENLITSISEGREIRSRIHLEEMHLEYNLIKELTAESFRLFHQVNRLFLKGNPLTIINDTFMTTNVTELYMPHCMLTEITSNAFYGLTPTLHTLDLSYNNLKEFPLLPLTKLSRLSIAGNRISQMSSENVKYFGMSLKFLDLSNLKTSGMSQESLKYLPNLRELQCNKQISVVDYEYLQHIGQSMEKLSLAKSSIQIIENGALYKLNSLKSLDLSYNAIIKIGNTTFRDVRHSLETLKLHNALKTTIFPYKALDSLSKLKYLDVSSNQIAYLPHESFATFQSLKYLNLNHNDLKELNFNFVNDIQNPHLEELKLAFNKLTIIKSHTFRNFPNLIYLQINDNLIYHIKKSSFLDLDSVTIIRLEGNEIRNIENEAFQNLPNIQRINLAYNKLTLFNLEAFNQVGRLSTLKIDVDHNNIQNLTINHTATTTSNNIKNINFSYNNISHIDSNYFDSIRLSVVMLDLSHNRISNITNHAFRNMANLQTLSLSFNLIETIERNELKGLKSLQILDLSKNKLSILSENLFHEQKKLRILNMSNNHIQQIHKDIFAKTTLEQLDLSFNKLDEFPVDAIIQIKNTLQFLDLNGNQIQSINFSKLISLENIRHISLSGNGLLLPDSSDEFLLSKLISLDLSHNMLTRIPEWMANQLPESLEILSVANTSLINFPDLSAHNIVSLNLSRNMIEAIEAKEVEQFNQLQIIDLSHNLLSTTFNNVWATLPHLKVLYLQNNPIEKLSNISFMNMERLQELFINSLNLQNIDSDAFQHLITLKKLELDIFPNNIINISQMLSKIQGLEELHLHIQDNVLDNIFTAKLPKSLKSITLEGKNLIHIGESAFSNINSKYLTVNIKNSNITRLSQKIFKNMKDVKNFTVAFINNNLQTIEKIYTGGKKAPNTNLKHLSLRESQLYCDCEFAWLWEWIQEYEYEHHCKEMFCEETYLHDLRETKCVNMNNRSIINVFKADLVCFSSGTPKALFSSLILWLSLIFILLYDKVNGF